jgi:hypothetical protein
MLNVAFTAGSRLGLVLATMLATIAGVRADPLADAARRLIAAYPAHIVRRDAGDIVWRDGRRMPLSDGRRDKDPATRLATADLTDMFALPYPRAGFTTPPARDADPGRARNRAFFDAMYGDCTKGEVARHLVDVIWLPKKWGKPLRITRINGVADKLAAVSAALDALPASFDQHLFPAAGTYNCRTIAGTNRVSAHGHGIAVDIATARADYWQWAGFKPGDVISYRNRVPIEIVRAFEAHGFIWGGAWYHYDTFHFEYRPELLIE